MMRRLLAAVALALLARPVRADLLAGLGQLLPPFLTTSFEDLIKAAAESCKALPLEALFSRPFTTEMPQLELVEFSADAHRVYRVGDGARRLRARPPAALALFVPGWWNAPTDEASLALVEALLTRIPMVLVLDTRPSFCRGYVASASRINALAHLLYDFLKRLHKQGYKIDSIHLIGFSLGAHVVGITGKLVQKGLNKKLSRITALDPAKPCIAQDYRLEKNDAKFVQVIHTSAGVLGWEEPIGDLDVYVNGVDVKQPECEDKRISLECDHAQAWKLFAASVADGRSLRGRRCDSWEQLRQGRCQGNKTALGYDSSADNRGMFLSRTQESAKKRDVETKVFNPAELLTWWLP